MSTIQLLIGIAAFAYVALFVSFGAFIWLVLPHEEDR